MSGVPVVCWWVVPLDYWYVVHKFLVVGGQWVAYKKSGGECLVMSVVSSSLWVSGCEGFASSLVVSDSLVSGVQRIYSVEAVISA